MPNSNQKQKSRALVVSTGRKGRRKGVISLPPYVRLAVDPWSASAEGAGRPDFNSTPTIPWPEMHVMTASTNAQGNFLVGIRGSLVNGIYVHTLDAAADPLTTGVTSVIPPNFTSMQSSFTSYRPLAVAVEAFYIGSETTASGTLGIVKTNGFPAANHVMSAFTDELSYKEGTVNDKVAAKYVADGSDFTTVASVNSTANQAIFVMGTGLPTGAVIRIHIKWFFEVQIEHTNLMSRDAKHTLSHPGQVATAASVLGPSASTAVGPDPVGKLVEYSEKLALTAGAVNGLWQSSKPMLSLMADFAGLL